MRSRTSRCISAFLGAFLAFVFAAFSLNHVFLGVRQVPRVQLGFEHKVPRLQLTKSVGHKIRQQIHGEQEATSWRQQSCCGDPHNTTATRDRSYRPGCTQAPTGEHPGGTESFGKRAARQPCTRSPQPRRGRGAQPDCGLKEAHRTTPRSPGGVQRGERRLTVLRAEKERAEQSLKDAEARRSSLPETMW